jgi:hypothetical protein
MPALLELESGTRGRPRSVLPAAPVPAIAAARQASYAEGSAAPGSGQGAALPGYQDFPDTTGPLWGLVYLLHFNELYIPYPDALPIACAGHYTGFAAGGPRALERRLAKHGTCEGAKLMAAVARAGITWQLARVWPGDRTLERRLKIQGGASRRCPLCGVTPRPSAALPRNADGSIARSLITDEQKAAAGLMTAAQQAEHTALRREAACGKLPRPVERGRLPAADDPWSGPLPALAAATC